MTVELASLMANTGALAALGADELDVGDVDRHLLVDDAALLTGSVGLDGLLGDGDALDDDLALGRQRAQDDALLAAILAGEHLDRSEERRVGKECRL